MKEVVPLAGLKIIIYLFDNINIYYILYLAYQ